MTEEYRDLCRRMVALLCRKRPSPLADPQDCSMLLNQLILRSF
ncbi:MAG: hypothetical protein WBQ37_02390 [Candidatus Competibacter sp.]